MHRLTHCARCLFLLLAVALVCPRAFGDPSNTFTIASYNVENWLRMTRDGKTNQPKPEAERAAVVDVLAKVKPDVLGVIEIGTRGDLAEMGDGLRKRGLDLPHSEWVQGADPDRHVALLSRFPIVGKFSRADYSYDLNGHPMRIQRGILDVLIQVNASCSFRAIVVHLKSRRATEEGDQAAMRLAEAKLLRAHVGKLLKNDPRLNLIVMGDLNDVPESDPVRTVLGESPFQLVDVRPRDSKGYDTTHLWRFRKQWSRIDYLLLSPGMSSRLVAGSAHIADVPGWNQASDHRTVYATFTTDTADASSQP